MMLNNVQMRRLLTAKLTSLFLKGQCQSCKIRRLWYHYIFTVSVRDGVLRRRGMECSGECRYCSRSVLGNHNVCVMGRDVEGSWGSQKHVGLM